MLNCIIIQTGDQIHSQHKSAAAIPVSLTQNAEDFQMPDNMFDYHTLARQSLVKFFLLSGQLAALGFLKRCPRVFVQREQTLITAVRQTFDCFRQIRFGVLIQRKIVSCAFGKSGVNNTARFLANSYLSFDRMPLFLARIVAFLFFFDGRSIGDSATSTTTISTSGDQSAIRFPGRANSPESVKISSTRVIIRDTDDSLMPQLVPIWNIVRYSRQYSSVSKIWSSITSFGGLPSTSRWATLFWRTISHILLKVSRSTPQYRLKLVADSFSSFL
jgi:hypothetical protein